MNEIVKAVSTYKYKNPSANKQRFIFNRTKKERIKNKAFGNLLIAYIAENPIARFGEVVMLHPDFQPLVDDYFSQSHLPVRTESSSIQNIHRGR